MIIIKVSRQYRHFLASLDCIHTERLETNRSLMPLRFHFATQLSFVRNTSTYRTWPVQYWCRPLMPILVNYHVCKQNVPEPCPICIQRLRAKHSRGRAIRAHYLDMKYIVPSFKRNYECSLMPIRMRRRCQNGSGRVTQIQ